MAQKITQNLRTLKRVREIIPSQVITNIKVFEAGTSFFGPAAVYRGKTTPIPQTMGNNDFRSGGSNYCEGFQYPFSSNSLPKFSTNNKDTSRGATSFKYGNTKLISKGTITQIPLSKDGYYSRIFLVPKKGGGMRPVIDLSSLNNFVESQHFQMENLSSIKTLLKQGDFMTKLNLKDAYLTIAMNPQSQKFLRFIWKGKTYQFKALPFGLNVAPLVFTKLLKPIAAFLRKQGIRLILYLDDMRIIGSSAQETMQFTHIAMYLLASLGFTIHEEKSITTPTQIITFLGFTINSITRQISLPPEKVTKTLILCRQMLTAETVSLRSLAQLLGLLESHRPAIWKAPLHFHHLQAQLIQDLQKHNHQYNVCTPLTRASKTELTWWLTNLQQVNGANTSRYNNIHGCFIKGLRCDLQQCQNERQMVFSGGPVTYKSFGI